jgi:hypothetical protein
MYWLSFIIIYYIFLFLPNFSTYAASLLGSNRLESCPILFLRSLGSNVGIFIGWNEGASLLEEASLSEGASDRYIIPIIIVI